MKEGRQKCLLPPFVASVSTEGQRARGHPGGITRFFPVRASVVRGTCPRRVVFSRAALGVQ
eukprot:861578-Alexandrium_andersonii.AAC.1